MRKKKDLSKRTQDKKSERSFYEDLFRKRHRFDPFQEEVYYHIARDLREKTRGFTVLDIGCGTGTQASYLLEQGFSVLAIDISMEGVKLTKSTAEGPGRTFLAMNGDAEFLPVKDSSVDACVCGLLLHHFKNFHTVAAEVKRVTRPGGIVIALDANAHNPFIWFYYNVLHRIRPQKRLTPNQCALRRKDIKKVFRKYGFGEFQFSSITGHIRQAWIGDSLGAKLIYYIRLAVMGLSRKLLPNVSHGSMLLSTFRRIS